MTPIEVKHLMLDLGLSTAEVSRILKKRFNTDLTQQYVGMMLSQQRVGYQHQGKVARILGVPVQRDLRDRGLGPGGRR